MNIHSLPPPPASDHPALQLIQEMSDAGFRKMDLDLMIEICLTGLSEALQSQGATLVMRETEEEWRLYPVFRCHFEEESENRFFEECKHSLRKIRSLPETVRFQQSPALRLTEQTDPQNLTEWAVFPLETKDQFLGLLFLDLNEKTNLPEELTPVLHQLCTGLMSVQNIRHLLINDPLTGCYNRWFMDVELTKFCQNLTGSSDAFALLVMDIDYFKQINDRYGHARGDHVLIRFADFLKTRLPGGAAAIRMGGDEFLLWFPETRDLDLETFGKKLLREAKSTLKISENLEKTITLSIGGIYHDPSKETVTKEVLLDRADQALYTSKHNGRNQMTLWTPELEQTPSLWKGTEYENERDTGELQEQISKLKVKIHRDQNRLVELLTNILCIKEFETGLHSHRVAMITNYLLQQVDLPEEEKTAIHRGAMLHDIGKIAIPERILHKEGPLDEEEWIIVKQHPQLGHRFIEHQGFLKSAGDIILYHHEHYDGSGYPRGLKGEKIPYGARLFTVVDAYDSMRANRVYRKYMPKDQAVEELHKKSGSQFDPEILDLFLQHIEEIEHLGHWES